MLVIRCVVCCSFATLKVNYFISIVNYTLTIIFTFHANLYSF